MNHLEVAVCSFNTNKTFDFIHFYFTLQHQGFFFFLIKKFCFLGLSFMVYTLLGFNICLVYINFFLFSFVLEYDMSLKQRKIIFKPRIKLNHNVHRSERSI